MPPNKSAADPVMTDCVTSSSSHLGNLFKEEDRRKTFEGWPNDHLSPEDLAKAGFYFLKRSDVVRCIFCGIEVGEWQEGDNAMADHRRWSPGCRFVNDQPVGNIPIGRDCDGGSDSGFDTPCCEPSSPGSDDGLGQEELGIQKFRRPAFPQNSTAESRLKTFETWPISLRLKPDALSEAGFFYTGKGDQTICFHCGGGLKDWEDSDEPWVEHSRWFPKCSFVLTIKGKEFVDKVTGKTLTSSINTEPQPEAPVEKAAPSLPVKQESENTQMNRDGRHLCKICFSDEVSVVFLPCGHLVACSKCALNHSTCSVCRKPIKEIIRAYLS